MCGLFQALQRAREAFQCGTTLSIDFRKRQLKALRRMYEENEAAFCASLAQDLKKVRNGTAGLVIVGREDTIYNHHIC